MQCFIRRAFKIASLQTFYRALPISVKNRGEKKRTVLFSPERKLYIVSFNKYATLKNVQINVTDMNVSEHMGWVRNVVLMSVYLGLGNPRGSVFRVGGQIGR